MAVTFFPGAQQHPRHDQSAGCVSALLLHYPHASGPTSGQAVEQHSVISDYPIALFEPGVRRGRRAGFLHQISAVVFFTSSCRQTRFDAVCSISVRQA